MNFLPQRMQFWGHHQKKWLNHTQAPHPSQIGRRIVSLIKKMYYILNEINLKIYFYLEPNLFPVRSESLTVEYVSHELFVEREKNLEMNRVLVVEWG